MKVLAGLPRIRLVSVPIFAFPTWAGMTYQTGECLLFDGIPDDAVFYYQPFRYGSR